MNGRSAKPRQHLIFLSHSGHDKPFVRKLYNALRAAGHHPFFDTHTLPVGEPFPAHIFENARACRLGVVVLSPNFLTSRWPMLELHCMHTSPSSPTILPLFFKLSPSDVKLSSPRFTEWRDAWQTLAIRSDIDPTQAVNLTEWEAAVTNLSSLSGVVHKPNEGDDIFIEKALYSICSFVRPQLRYMVSHLTGRKRLTKMVATQFDKTQPFSHFEAQAIGLHGVGGQGKTTICKLMVNHYAAVYAGRSTLIELPSGDCEEAHVLNQCKKALQQLTNISDGRIGCVDNLDQCLQLFQERVADLDVLIAIDNIWEKHLEFAQRIVDIGFSKGSKLLATSRSRQVLINLLKDRGSVMPLPRLKKEEAHQIFINSFNRNHSCGSVHLEESDVDEMTSRFQFEHQYHPLGISALGVALGKMGRQGWPATWNKMGRFDIGSNDNVVTKAIRMNYDSIPKIRRDVFLDVALIYIPKLHGHVPRAWISKYVDQYRCSRVDENFDPLHTWLSALYEGRMGEWEIRRTLMQLTFDGLLEFDGPLECGHKEVRVHDLYTDLAIQEGAGSSEFVVDQEKLREMKDTKWTEVGRVVLEGGNLLRKPLPRLQLLMAVDCDRGWCSRLDPLPELRVLQVRNKDDGVVLRGLTFKQSLTKWKEGKVEFVGWKKWLHENACWTLKARKYKLWKGLKQIPRLGWLELKAVACKDISDLIGLHVLKLEGCRMFRRQLCLSRLLNLQFLHIERVHCIEEITGLGSLINLKSFVLHDLLCLRKVNKFSGCLMQLQVVEVVDCAMLELDVEGLGLLPNLKALSLTQSCLCDCREALMFTGSLQALSLYDVGEEQPNLRGMGALEFLNLEYKRGRSVLGIHDLPRLKSMVLRGEVNEIADIRQLPSLEIIRISISKGLKEIDWSSFHGLSNLKEIIIHNCRDLKNVKGDPSGIAHTLPLLTIRDCENLEDVAGLDMFTKCRLRNCKAIKPQGESSILVR